MLKETIYMFTANNWCIWLSRDGVQLKISFRNEISYNGLLKLLSVLFAL